MSIGNLDTALAGSTALTGSLNSAIETAGQSCDIFGTLSSLIEDTLSQALKNAEKSFQSFIGGLGGLASQINEGLSSIKDVYDNIVSKINQIGGSLTGALASIGDSINDALGQINSAISGISDAISGALEGINQAIGGITGLLGDMVSVLAAAACTGLMSALSNVPSGVSNLADSLNNAGSGAAAAAAATSASAAPAVQLMTNSTAAAEETLAGAGDQAAQAISESKSQLESQLVAIEGLIASGGTAT